MSHPGIVKIFDIGVLSNEKPYILMEYLDGETLMKKLQHSRLSLLDASRFIRQLSSAMSVAHENGVIHGDLKPSNIMIIGNVYSEEKEQAKVIDFGAAKVIGQRSPIWDNSGEIVGTPAYMSPEVIKGDQQITAKSDVYTLGAVFYELLAGRPAYVRDNVMALLAMKISEDPLPLHKIVSDIPKRIADLVHAMLSRESKDRPDMGIIKNEITDLLF